MKFKWPKREFQLLSNILSSLYCHRSLSESDDEEDGKDVAKVEASSDVKLEEKLNGAKLEDKGNNFYNDLYNCLKKTSTRSIK